MLLGGNLFSLRIHRCPSNENRSGMRKGSEDEDFAAFTARQRMAGVPMSKACRPGD